MEEDFMYRSFISASSEPSGCACTSIRRLPRGSNTPSACCGVFDCEKKVFVNENDTVKKKKLKLATIDKSGYNKMDVS